jgi:hypothetical protein
MAKLTRKQIKEGLEQIPIDSLLLGSAVNASASRLSPKDREFARLVAMGESKASAYRKTRDSKGNKTTHKANGYKISKKADVQQTIELFAQAKQFTDSHTPEQLRSFIVQQLTAHAANDDNPPSVRINALKILGTVAEIGAFETRAVVQHVKASGDIRSRIMDKLQLIGASSTMEHNAEQDDAQDADSLLHELIGTPSEAQDGDPTPTGTPQLEGVDGAEGSHIIPHSQSCDFADPHTQSSSIPHIQTLTDSDPLTDSDTETLQCREIER